MNRNTEAHFTGAELTNLQRSTFVDVPNKHLTTFNVGQLIPIFVDSDIMPGDTFAQKIHFVLRTTTLIKPYMDNLWLDIWAFFVPHRLTWNHWKNFMGENKEGAWANITEYVVPQFTTPTGGAKTGTLMDYMGIPTFIEGLKFQQLPFRAYILTVNRWFRDQNLIAPLTEYEDDTDRTADNEVTELGGAPFMVAKKHDYFTSCLPGAQKGAPVAIPLGTEAQVKFKNTYSASEIASPYWFNMADGSPVNAGQILVGSTTGTNAASVTTAPQQIGTIAYADLTDATSATINALRLAVQTQKLLEHDAIRGTRYIEVIASQYGVHSSDARLQYPEYLGGKCIPISVEQVNQTSSTDTNSPQANEAGYSLTADSDHVFTKSFEEHGTLLVLAAVRQDHTYQQGLNRMWSRRRRFDYYFPVFAHLGEQPVLNKEIYATGTSTDDEVFGYQEHWAEYKYKPNRVSGTFRSNSKDAEGNANSLDVWHLADNYTALPVLSKEWITETDSYFKRVLAMPEEAQIRGDFFFETTMTRVMPVYCTPGLMDHF